ncbi:hypothetical protein [Streptomyces acidiscabies]|uniref:hypothetical protein n=1 Tax=Streptomyces acidiscabies TaxID=42234 RepID=UPI0009525D1E|nr:hypothetical protein [Streptomyces acidiscabies]
MDSVLEEITYAYDQLAADGVALLTHTHGVYLGDPLLEPMFTELDLRVIVPHCGGALPVLADRIAEFMHLFPQTPQR